MSKITYTPGPWILEQSNRGKCFNAVSAEGHGEFATVVVQMEEPFDANETAMLKGNAYLIYAALDMYTALKELVAILDGDDKTDSFTTQPARAAIAKAEGA